MIDSSTLELVAIAPRTCANATAACPNIGRADSTGSNPAWSISNPPHGKSKSSLATRLWSTAEANDSGSPIVNGLAHNSLGQYSESCANPYATWIESSPVQPAASFPTEQRTRRQPAEASLNLNEGSDLANVSIRPVNTTTSTVARNEPFGLERCAQLPDRHNATAAQINL